ncbi:MAG: hypothetical protein R3228_15100 [Halioglobus sp.]|nr:hypothetical protein [Halioglobus sp.]
MAYYCRDCSYTGKAKSQTGACPACGSFNYGIRGAAGEQAPAPKRWRLVLVILLWGYLMVHIGWKLAQ